ncbi:MAG TPA: alpha/beta hydrolase-fold protein [Chitinophagaceae bacterium]|nr:alpha/beta hydrolase-fold protein [Chitinophagaceae bacterium]
MQKEKAPVLVTEELLIPSVLLNREVKLSCFLPSNVAAPEEMGLLLINDGQNMEELGLAGMLNDLLSAETIYPLVCVGIHTGKERMLEYGTAAAPDYLGRGSKAGAYTRFVLEELIPFLQTTYAIAAFKEISFAGFSLGGLSAMDIVWNHPDVFSRVGVFSGSFWWRTRALDEGYDEATDRIMHRQVQQGGFYPWLKFFFETGALDETMDRNHNGIIDSIDDTLALIDALLAKGYHPQHDIHYLELQEGRHNIATWAHAMPEFLTWGWGKTDS